jgi:hypothetical protein
MTTEKFFEAIVENLETEMANWTLSPPPSDGQLCERLRFHAGAFAIWP